MMRHSARHSLPQFLILALLASPALAVAQTGTVAGTVRRVDGTPVSGARVAVRLPARAATTDQQGRYTLRGLPGGTYQVTYSAIGQRLQQRAVNVTAGQTTVVDVRLESGPLMLEGIVTSATRTPAEASRVAATVNVLTREQVRTSPARESQDLLREIPGVELPRTSSLVGGSAQIVSIRGVDEGRTAVLFDGIPVNDAWGEWIDWGRVPKSLVDRVEVLEGGGSNLYGNGAMGGVISFFARPITPGSYELQADGGSRDAKHVFASAGVPLAHALTAMVSGDYLDGGGYVMVAPSSAGPVDHPSQISSRNGLARIEYAPTQHVSAFVSGNFYNDNRDLGTALAHTNRDDKRTTFGADVDGDKYGTVTLRGWDGVLSEDQWASAVSPAVGRTTERQTSWQHIPTHDWGASLQWARNNLFGLQTLLAGADVRKMTGNVAEEDYAANGSVSANILSGGSQLLSGAFVQGILAPVEPLRIEVGGRYDRWGNNDGFAADAGGTTEYPDATRNHFSPRIGATYRLGSALTLRAAAYDAFRAPNLAELYRKFVSGPNSNLPNPALRPESARGQEAGFDLQPAHWLQLRGTYYSAIYSDFNSFVTIAPAVRQRQNIQRSRSTGGEGYLALHPVEPLLLSASVNYDHAVVVSNDANPAAVGTYIGRVPQQRQVIRATYATPLLGSLTALWRHEGKNSTFNGTQLDPFTVVDLNYTRDLLPGLSGFVSMENVGNVAYQVNLSGALVSLGLPRTIRIGGTVARE